MIQRTEIDAKGKEFEINTSDVQRDYVFGWLLYGIFTVSNLRDIIFLKGGNALRKGYFENTRYSSDLDFGIPNDIDPAFLLSEINTVCDFIQEKAEVTFVKDRNKVEEKFPPGENAPLPDLKVYELDVYFKNFYGNAERFTLRISMDVTRFDRTIYPLVMKSLIHPYSDAADIVCEIRCMKLEEIIATKLKCMVQRQSAPDLFDYVYSIQLLGGSLNKEEVRRALIQKTIFDRNPYLLKDILKSTDFGFFRSAWTKSIVCAKQYMIEVEYAISVFLSDIETLFTGIANNGYTQFVYFPAGVRSKILQAARTQTRLKVTYKHAERVVEPYSLKYLEKRSGDAKEYLYVYNCSGGENAPGQRMFVSENLQSIENTIDKFEPRYPIELSKSGELPENPYLFDPNKPERAPRTRRTTSVFGRGRPTPRISTGLKYVFKCSSCGKKSVRSSYDSSQNPHKGKNGYPCYGYPIYVTMKY